MLLEGKVAIVSGASRGIGQAIVTALLEEGANVVLTSRKLEPCHELLNKLGISELRATVLRVDVARKDLIDEAVGLVMEKYRRIDILVNNAGVPGSGAIEEVDEATWDRIFEVNVRGVFLFTKAVVPIMKRQRSGSVINIASVGGKVGLPFNSVYCATKHAVIGFNNSLAPELAPFGIRVNSVCPGRVDTEMLRDAIEVVAKDNGVSSEEFRKRALAAVPLGRFAEPREIASIVVFLASDSASYVTGAAIAATGAAWSF